MTQQIDQKDNSTARKFTFKDPSTQNQAQSQKVLTEDSDFEREDEEGESTRKRVEDKTYQQSFTSQTNTFRESFQSQKPEERKEEKAEEKKEEEKKVQGLPLGKLNKIKDFNDEFMSNYDQFSESWRAQIRA